jgi:outer membrane biogenesis lipoprotein LolB
MRRQVEFIKRHSAGCRFCLSLAILGLLLVTGGCAVTTLPESKTVAAPERAAPALTFVLTGRISVRVDDRIDSGQLRWERDGPRDTERIALMTPLGSQVAELTREGMRAEFRRGEERRTGEISALTESLIGVSLDLNQIAGWVQGEGLDVQGQGRAESRDGRRWDISAEGPLANSRTWIARRLTLQSGGTVVKLVVDVWEAP